MSDVSDALRHLFPDIDFRAHCELVDDGSGPRIVRWMRAEPQPTVAEIEAAMPLADAKIAQDAQDRATLAAHEQQAKLALTRLAEIQADATMTNARATQAVRDLAQIVERLVRLQTRQAR